ncbi:metalloregulator ArsR/SmtB family transcription factor [Paeniglutamicibacter sp. NPDC091659]|uniref:metalloregulator ArsR/SmtB family transcription factor n=1 Tax=Paeniglutamicibacter sp. NPDC091659 TaxID=3364389 RepID=UPI003829026B
MSESTADVFTAPAHPARRQILQDLGEDEQSASDMAGRFTSSAPTISRHLSGLRATGLITERREASGIPCSLAGERLALSVGGFCSAACPERMLLRGLHHRAPSAARPAEISPESSLES